METVVVFIPIIAGLTRPPSFTNLARSDQRRAKATLILVLPAATTERIACCSRRNGSPASRVLR